MLDLEKAQRTSLTMQVEASLKSALIVGALRPGARLITKEIADQLGISRQGVHDAIKAAEAQLVKYEDMLGLVRRYREMEKAVAACREELGNIRPQPGSEGALDRARASLELIERIER